MRGDIDVSIALLGGGDVIPIVLLRREKRALWARSFLSFRPWVGFLFVIMLGLFFSFLSFFFTLDFFYVVFRARCFQETENRISINKLDRRRRSPGLFVEALKLPIWKLKKTKVQFRYCLSFLKKKRKRFSVCWKRQRCDKLKKKKKAVQTLYCHIVFQY